MPKSVGDLLRRMSLDEKVAQLSGPPYEQLDILAMGTRTTLRRPSPKAYPGLPRTAWGTWPWWAGCARTWTPCPASSPGSKKG